MRTSCSTGGPLPEAAPRPLSSAPLLPFLVLAANVPAGVVAPVPNPLLPPRPPVVDDALPFTPRRSRLDVADVPEPGAIWLSALSSGLEDEPPMNISVNVRAICFASPY